MKKTTERALLPLLTALLGFVASPFLRGLWDWCADVALPQFSKQQKLSLLATLSMLCLAEASWIYRLRKKGVLNREYTPDLEWPGTYRHLKNRAVHVCGVCQCSLFIGGSNESLACNKCGRGILRKPSWYS